MPWLPITKKDTRRNVKIFKDKYIVAPREINCGWGKVISNEDKVATVFELAMPGFKWSSRPYKAHDHQIITANFLCANPRAFCWNEAGTGKTAACLWAYSYLKSTGIEKLLIICPLSTSRAVWWKECFKLLPHLQCEVLVGSKDKRKKLLASGADILVVNHDGIKVLKDDFKIARPEVIIVDESTAFKNVGTDRWKALRDLTARARYVWMLTGTPAPQGPTDLFGQARIICPDAVGRSFNRFRDKVMFQVGPYQFVPRENFEQTVKELIKPVIRFSRDDCLDLPDVVYQNYEIELSSEQREMFEKLRKNAVVQIENGLITAVNEGVMRSKLLQCCCGYVYSTEDSGGRSVYDLSPTVRLQTLVDIINESSRGVLVFIPFLSAIDNVFKHLERLLGKISCGVICGETTLKKRSELFDKFQDSKLKVLIAHPKTMGHGVTLTAADTVVWYLVTSDNELYEQANSRIQRIGQEHKMRVIHLLSTSLEKKVLARLQQKQAMQGVLLETLKEGV